MSNNSRKAIRDAVLGNKHYRKEVLKVFGTEIELRQPSLRLILSAQQDDDQGRAVATMLTNYCYVPGTDDLVFDKADIEALLELPFGDDMQKINKAIERLTGVDSKAVAEAVVDIKENPTSKTSL